MDHRATDSEIVVFWDKPEKLSGEVTYTATLTHNGAKVSSCRVNRTHCGFDGLKAGSEYEIEVRLESGESLGTLTARTGKVKRVIDITKAPYNAIPDGKTINTASIQKALDDCDGDSLVYIPSGSFLTGALDIHSDSELLLAEGALLQGTSNPADYLPLIKSRFEGYERQCYRSLLNLGTLDHDAGFNCENVVIRGKGKIYGGGFDLAK
nr:glycoside hydrolase family 28 protein [Lachnospiraceae bacterium]